MGGGGRGRKKRKKRAAEKTLGKHKAVTQFEASIFPVRWTRARTHARAHIIIQRSREFRSRQMMMSVCQMAQKRLPLFLYVCASTFSVHTCTHTHIYMFFSFPPIPLAPPPRLTGLTPLADSRCRGSYILQRTYISSHVRNVRADRRAAFSSIYFSSPAAAAPHART